MLESSIKCPSLKTVNKMSLLVCVGRTMSDCCKGEKLLQAPKVSHCYMLWVHL